MSYNLNNKFKELLSDIDESFNAEVLPDEKLEFLLSELKGIDNPLSLQAIATINRDISLLKERVQHLPIHLGLVYKIDIFQSAFFCRALAEQIIQIYSPTDEQLELWRSMIPVAAQSKESGTTLLRACALHPDPAVKEMVFLCIKSGSNPYETQAETEPHVFRAVAAIDASLLAEIYLCSQVPYNSENEEVLLTAITPFLNNETINGDPWWYLFLKGIGKHFHSQDLRQIKAFLPKIMPLVHNRAHTNTSGHTLLEEWYFDGDASLQQCACSLLQQALAMHDTQLVLHLLKQPALPLIGECSLLQLAEQIPEFGEFLGLHWFLTSEVITDLKVIEKILLPSEEKNIVEWKHCLQALENKLLRLDTLWPLNAERVRDNVSRITSHLGLDRRTEVAEQFINENKRRIPRLTVFDEESFVRNIDPVFHADVHALLLENRSFHQLERFEQLLEPKISGQVPTKTLTTTAVCEIASHIFSRMGAMSTDPAVEMQEVILDALAILSKVRAEIEFNMTIADNERQGIFDAFERQEKSLITMHNLIENLSVGGISITVLWSRVRSLLLNEKLDFPLCVPIISAQQAALVAIERQKDGTFKILLFNTGEGMGQYHGLLTPYSRDVDRYRPYFTMKNVPLVEIVDKLKLFLFLKGTSSQANMEDVYKIVLKLAEKGTKEVLSKDKAEYIQLQMGRTCYKQSVYAFLRYMMSRESGHREFQETAAYRELKPRKIVPERSSLARRVDFFIKNSMLSSLKECAMQIALAQMVAGIDRFDSALHALSYVFERGESSGVTSEGGRLMEVGSTSIAKTTARRYRFLRSALRYLSSRTYDQAKLQQLLADDMDYKVLVNCLCRKI